MTTELPIPAGFFPKIDLNDNEKQFYSHFAEEKLHNLLLCVTNEEAFRWINCEPKDGVNIRKAIYIEQRGSQAGSACLLCRGTISVPGTINEVLEVLSSPVTEEYRRLMHNLYGDDFLDGVCLYSTPSTILSSRGCKVGIKWAAYKDNSVQKDYCFLEYSGIQEEETDNQEKIRFGFCIQESIPREKEVPVMFGFRRDRWHRRGILVRPTPGRRDVVSVTFLVQTDATGSYPSSPRHEQEKNNNVQLAEQSMRKKVAVISKIAPLLDRRRLSEMKFVDKWQWVPDDQRKHCAICSRSFQLRRKHHCRVCGEVVCSTCAKQRELDLGSLGLTKIRVCTGCVMRARQDKLNNSNNTDSRSQMNCSSMSTNPLLLESSSSLSTDNKNSFAFLMNHRADPSFLMEDDILSQSTAHLDSPDRFEYIEEKKHDEKFSDEIEEEDEEEDEEDEIDDEDDEEERNKRDELNEETDEALKKVDQLTVLKERIEKIQREISFSQQQNKIVPNNDNIESSKEIEKNIEVEQRNPSPSSSSSSTTLSVEGEDTTTSNPVIEERKGTIYLEDSGDSSSDCSEEEGNSQVEMMQEEIDFLQESLANAQNQLQILATRQILDQQVSTVERQVQYWEGQAGVHTEDPLVKQRKKLYKKMVTELHEIMGLPSLSSTNTEIKKLCPKKKSSKKEPMQKTKRSLSTSSKRKEDMGVSKNHHSAPSKTSRSKSLQPTTRFTLFDDSSTIFYADVGKDDDRIAVILQQIKIEVPVEEEYLQIMRLLCQIFTSLVHREEKYQTIKRSDRFFAQILQPSPSCLQLLKEAGYISLPKRFKLPFLDENKLTTLIRCLEKEIA